MSVGWRKVLYERQPFADNHCGEQFMQGLRNNVTARVYTYGEAVRGALALCHRLSLVYVFAGAFALLYGRADDDGDGEGGADSTAGAALLIALDALGAALVYVALVLRRRATGVPIRYKSDVSTACVVLCFGYAATPILITLAESISTDTIYAMACAMFAGHLCFADYGLHVDIVSRTMSLNMAVFGAVCLQSRLRTTAEAFGLLMLALALFAFWPHAQCELLPAGSRGFVALVSAVLCPFSVGLLWPVSPQWSAAAGASLLAVALCCPALLVRMQPMKNTIHGPWDEAMIADHKDDVDKSGKRL